MLVAIIKHRVVILPLKIKGHWKWMTDSGFCRGGGCCCFCLEGSC